MLIRGVLVKRGLAGGLVRSELARLIDFGDRAGNDFVMVSQFTIEGDRHTRRSGRGVIDR